MKETLLAYGTIIETYQSNLNYSLSSIIPLLYGFLKSSILILLLFLYNLKAVI